jgi:hypothetical protein
MRAALLPLVVLLGCGDDSREPPDAGERSCELELCAPYTCDQRLGRCLTQCASELDCVEAHACSAGFCIGTECTEATAGERCAGYACVQGTCSPDCASASCADGYYCRGDTHECVPTCTTREDPICAGYLCDVETGECESYCFDGELPCATGYTCDADKQCSAEAA